MDCACSKGASPLTSLSKSDSSVDFDSCKLRQRQANSPASIIHLCVMCVAAMRKYRQKNTEKSGFGSRTHVELYLRPAHAA